MMCMGDYNGRAYECECGWSSEPFYESQSLRPYFRYEEFGHIVKKNDNISRLKEHGNEPVPFQEIPQTYIYHCRKCQNIERQGIVNFPSIGIKESNFCSECGTRMRRISIKKMPETLTCKQCGKPAQITGTIIMWD